jgi:hypothetical protein
MALDELLSVKNNHLINKIQRMAARRQRRFFRPTGGKIIGYSPYLLFAKIRGDFDSRHHWVKQLQKKGDNEICKPNQQYSVRQ